MGRAQNKLMERDASIASFSDACFDQGIMPALGAAEQRC